MERQEKEKEKIKSQRREYAGGEGSIGLFC